MKENNTIEDMSYVEFMAFLSETNRPPGGKVAFKKMVDYCNINESDKILDVGCNTGFCSYEAVYQKKCKVMGIDISPDMIEEANKKLNQDTFLKNKIKFIVADAKKMPFEDNEFDFVFSGGSTAFIDDIKSGLKEYKRVVKDWGFIGDINFYYKRDPPQEVIDGLNELMGTNIQRWTKEKWIEIYQESGLEVFDVLEDTINEVDDLEVEKYIEALLFSKSKEVKIASKEKLKKIMELFNENHRYLSYGIFVLRKRTNKEEPYLFYP